MTRPSTTVRTGKCRHARVVGYMWRETPKHLSAIGVVGQWSRAFFQPGEAGHHDKIVCQSCRAWLSLGPARDTPDVMVEVRAAEIAANVADYRERRTPYTVTIDEDIGWRQGVRDGDTPSQQRQQLAGYLARCIGEGEK
jgi:hypothetical protein